MDRIDIVKHDLRPDLSNKNSPFLGKQIFLGFFFTRINPVKVNRGTVFALTNQIIVISYIYTNL